MSTFPPIADYGFLSNCEQSCLVAADGAVEWMCLPRPDSPSVFAALLDRAAGSFRFGPGNTQVPQHRRYVPGTMVLAPTDVGATGVLLRRATCISGRVEAVVNCAPLFDYGTAGGTWTYRGDGYESMTIAPKEGDLRLDLSGNGP